MSNSLLAAIILAAGQRNSRMKSQTLKSYTLCGNTLLGYALETTKTDPKTHDNSGST